MITKIKFVDVLKSFECPGIVQLHYTHDGVQMLAKVKAGSTGLYCPACGGLTPVLQATRRGLACPNCNGRFRAANSAQEG